MNSTQAIQWHVLTIGQAAQELSTNESAGLSAAEAPPAAPIGCLSSLAEDVAGAGAGARPVGSSGVGPASSVPAESSSSARVAKARAIARAAAAPLYARSRAYSKSVVAT